MFRQLFYTVCSGLAVILYNRPQFSGLSILHCCWSTSSSSSSGLFRAGRCRSYELAPCLSILRSVVGGCTCGTIYHFISVNLNYRFPSFAGYWKRICLTEDRGAKWPTFRCIAIYKCTYLLISNNCAIKCNMDIIKRRRKFYFDLSSSSFKQTMYERWWLFGAVY